MMEIPAGKVCDGAIGEGRDRRYWACPFFSDDEGTETCSAFDVNMYSVKCPACLTAYPNGATIEIKPKEASCK
jgi:hypothetical protein